MSITNYTELQSAVQNWMDRFDSTFQARLPECIGLAEAYFQRKLRSREMITTATLTTTGGSVSLPVDFLQCINLYWTGNPPTTLQEWDEQNFENQYGTLSTGIPQAFLIRGPVITVAPVDDVTQLKLVYYQKIPPLATNGTNWLLAAHPDLYLFGTLVEAEAYTLDGQAAAAWGQRRDDVLAEVWRSGQFYRNAAQAMRVAGATP